MEEGRWRRNATDHATVTMATTRTRVGREKADAPTAAQTSYNARDTLANRLDDATVRQAVEGDL